MSPAAAARSLEEAAHLPDAELVRRVRGGAGHLFELLVRRHGRRIRGVIRPILRHGPEIEDAIQQTYLLAFTGLGRFAGASSFGTWVSRIAANEAMGRLPGQARLVLVGDVPEPDGASARGDPEGCAAMRESREAVEEAIERLPAASRAVLILRAVQELSTAETARRLGLTKESVRVRLHRARRALRRALAER